MNSTRTRLFEIPIYRTSEDEWIDDITSRVDARLKVHMEMSQEDGGQPLTLSELEDYRSESSLIERPTGWRYNEIVAWIVLEWDGPGPVVKGYAWVVGTTSGRGGLPRRRYQRGFKPYPFVGGDSIYKVMEVWFGAEDSDRAVYDVLYQELLGLRSEPQNWLRRRHLDLDCFETIGPQVRWRDLLGLSGR